MTDVVRERRASTFKSRSRANAAGAAASAAAARRVPSLLCSFSRRWMCGGIRTDACEGFLWPQTGFQDGSCTSHPPQAEPFQPRCVCVCGRQWEGLKGSSSKADHGCSSTLNHLRAPHCPSHRRSWESACGRAPPPGRTRFCRQESVPAFPSVPCLLGVEDRSSGQRRSLEGGK